jgi:hypothetical protein
VNETAVNDSVSSGYKVPSVFNPEEIMRKKRESDMVFRNIKRYTQKSTNQSINASCETNVSNLKKKSMDDEGMRAYKFQVIKNINEENQAIVEFAKQVRSQGFKVPLNLMYEQTNLIISSGLQTAPAG